MGIFGVREIIDRLLSFMYVNLFFLFHCILIFSEEKRLYVEKFKKLIILVQLGG